MVDVVKDDIKVTKKPHVVVLLDESGSMSPQRASVVSTFNEYVNSVRETAETLSLYTFDSTGIREKMHKKDLADVPELTLEDYRPNAMTPLYDAMGKVMAKFDDLENVQFVSHTDGMENDSREFNFEKLDEYIKAKTKAGWLFVYLGEGEVGKAAMSNFSGVKVNFSAANRGASMDTLATSTRVYASTGVNDIGAYTSNLDGSINVDSGESI